LFVIPGTGATGAMSPYNADLSNLTFAVSGASGASGVTGSSLSITIATGASGPVVTFDASALTRVINNMVVTQTYDPNMTETKTGATYNGKPVYRQTWSFNVSQTNNTYDNRDLIANTGYVQSIVNTGGWFATGNSGTTGVYNEKYPIGASMSSNNTQAPNGSYVLNNQVYGFPLVSTQNQLQFTSLSTQSRNNAPVYVWVDYTKVDDNLPAARSTP
jgi:hypothetical protein